jgi:hypothetical protein
MSVLLPSDVLAVLSRLEEGGVGVVLIPELKGEGFHRPERSEEVKVVRNVDGHYEGYVGGTNFGGGVRFGTAVNRIRARLEYLWENPGWLVVTSKMREDAQAASTLRELRRRQKIQRSFR